MLPPTFFITFSTYGQWLHGDNRGSVDRTHNTYESPLLPVDLELKARRRDAMTDEPFVLNDVHRRVVLQACLRHASFRGWQLLAAHVRTNHVHLVVRGDEEPERMMTEFKAYASRALNEAGGDGPNRKRWARHGSTRHLYSDEAVANAVRYTVEDQGESMAVHRLEESP